MWYDMILLWLSLIMIIIIMLNIEFILISLIEKWLSLLLLRSMYPNKEIYLAVNQRGKWNEHSMNRQFWIKEIYRRCISWSVESCCCFFVCCCCCSSVSIVICILFFLTSTLSSKLSMLRMNENGNLMFRILRVWCLVCVLMHTKALLIKWVKVESLKMATKRSKVNVKVYDSQNATKRCHQLPFNDAQIDDK